MLAACSTNWESLTRVGQRGVAESPAAQPHQEALRNLGAAERGASKTVPPASTREEEAQRTLPSKAQKLPLGSETVIFDKCVLGNFAFHWHFREIQMMTWEEITDLLITFGEKVHVIRGDNAEAVSL